ncbi:cation transporter [Clostridium estertheticum]|uniref:cation transporter n=1 Tax=Clostridium estertheticum TaxID=238834 RepID=UPI001C0D0061|nr:cation transporter [Clostridium estertheticum]MBU3216533.1 cation transporter [Clostridium estertheticum]WAG54476.1 cation transporter [Clostridium estertheticum]
MKKNYKVEVDCAACVLKMEEATKKTNGIKDAQIGFMTQKMTVEFEDGTDVNATMDAVVRACKKVEPDCEIYVK